MRFGTHDACPDRRIEIRVVVILDRNPVDHPPGFSQAVQIGSAMPAGLQIRCLRHMGQECTSRKMRPQCPRKVDQEAHAVEHTCGTVSLKRGTDLEVDIDPVQTVADHKGRDLRSEGVDSAQGTCLASPDISPPPKEISTCFPSAGSCGTTCNAGPSFSGTHERNRRVRICIRRQCDEGQDHMSIRRSQQSGRGLASGCSK